MTSNQYGTRILLNMKAVVRAIGALKPWCRNILNSFGTNQCSSDYSCMNNAGGQIQQHTIDGLPGNSMSTATWIVRRRPSLVETSLQYWYMVITATKMYRNVTLRPFHLYTCTL